MPKHFKILLIVLLLGGLVLPAVVQAQWPTIHVCFSNATGGVRVVTSGDSCASSEAHFSMDLNDIAWLMTMLKGDQGDMGPQGPEGPQGPQGVQGPSGLTDVKIVQTATGQYTAFSISTSATCPSGYVLTGGGATINPAYPNIFITSSYPSSSTRWQASASQVSGGTLNSWGLNVYVVCAKITS